MKQKFQAMTIREMKERHPRLFQEFEKKAKSYCTRLFDLNNKAYYGSVEFIGSGTFVRIGGCIGILTNYHVVRVFKDRGWVYVPNYASSLIDSLEFDLIVPLPWYPPEWLIRGVDIAFIRLKSKELTKIESFGCQIWDLDVSAKKWFSQKINFRKKDTVNKYFWGVEATPSNDDKVTREGSVICFEQAGFHDLAPEIPNIFTATVRHDGVDFIKKIDEFRCAIHHQGKDGLNLPHSYAGTSGSALWRGIGVLPDQDIIEFELAGIFTEEFKVGKCHITFCLGSKSLYDTFYKFCMYCLMSQDEVAALKHAGFVEK